MYVISTGGYWAFMQLFTRKQRKAGDPIIWYTGLPVVVAAVAVVMDLSRARVENGWILLSLGAGFLLRWQAEGARGLADYGGGVLLPLVLLLWLFYFRMLGPGDIKLFCALGGFMGTDQIWKCILVSFALGAVISLAVLISLGEIRHRIQYFNDYIRECLYTGKIRPYTAEEWNWKIFILQYLCF